MKDFEIYYTSDTHGKILPVDYATGETRSYGLSNMAVDLKKRRVEPCSSPSLSKCAEHVDNEHTNEAFANKGYVDNEHADKGRAGEERAANSKDFIESNKRFLRETHVSKDSDVLVLDGGDSLQGTPMITYYLEHSDSFSFHPVAEAFNAMGLDFYTLGNHDFNNGYDVIRDYVNALQGTLLIANVEDLRGEIRHKKYVICTLASGLRVGITGVVTDHVNVWEQPANLTELRVTDPLSAADEMYKLMQQEGCDITICIYHGGYEEDLESHARLTDSRENIACEMCHKLNYDIMLTGHQHMAVPGLDLYGTWSVQPPANAERYIYLKGSFDEDHGLSCTSDLISVGDETDEAVKSVIMPLEELTEKWLDEAIGEFKDEIEPEDKLDIALHGSKVAALFNQVQLESAESDFSCTSIGNTEIGFKKHVSIRDIFAAYTFANTSEVKEVTADILKSALERCAQYLDLDTDGKPYISDVFMKPKIEHYNYDFYAGLDYAFDLRRPVGDRVVRMRMLDGTPLDPNKKYKLITSNYRATGTGGYEMIGKSKTVFSTADNVQDLLVDYVRRHHELVIPDNYKFEVLY